MKTITKRMTATGASLGAVAAIVVGVAAFATASPESTIPTPTETAVVLTVPADAPNGLAAEQEAEALAAETARLAAEEAARLAAEEEAARQAAESEADVTPRPSEQAAPPAPAPAPPAAAPPQTCPSGFEPIEFDAAGNATACMPPACFVGEIDPSDPACAVVRP